MPNEIDDLIAEAIAGKRTTKGTYKPAKGEEAIFAAPEKKGVFDLTDPVMPFLMAMPTSMAKVAASLLIPGYSQLTGETPWRDPQGSAVASLLDIANVVTGYATGGMGRGIAKASIPKGASSISKALEEIMASLGKRGGLPTGPVERGWTRRGAVSPVSKGIQELGTGEGAKQLVRGGIEAPASSLAEQKLIETAAQKRLPQYAGPTAPRGIPQPYAPQTWRERTFPGTIKNAQDVIEDLFRESLRAKGMID